MKFNTRSMPVLGMLTALAYAAVATLRFQMVASPPLSFEPKDVVINIGGFLLGPLASFGISVTVAFLEMVTFSGTGPIGFLMNILSSCSFTCTAAFIYSKNRTRAGSVMALASGCFAMTAVMMLWNYLIVPIYTGVPREAVVGMLLPVFLPFNMIKSVINAGLTMLIYKPVVSGLRAAGLLPKPSESRKWLSAPTMLLSALVTFSAVAIALAVFDII